MLGRWTCDQQVAGSNPGRPAVHCNLGKLFNTHVPPSPSSIIWYQPMGGDAVRAGKVALLWSMVDLVDFNKFSYTLYSHHH